MDKVLSRPIFRNTYLKTIKKPVSNFSKGGIAALGVRNYKLGGDVTGFTPEETQNLVNYTIAGQLLQGVRQPGQSQASALLSNLGSGLEKSIPVTMEAKKLNIEAGTKNVPNLIDVYNTETKQTEKVPDRVVYADYLNSAANAQQGVQTTPKYLAPASAIDQQTQRTMAEGKAKEKLDQQKAADEGIIKAYQTSNLQNELANNVENSTTFTGKLNDVSLLYTNVKGTVNQLLNNDKSQNPDLYNQNYSTVENEVNRFKPNADQATKTMLTDLVYSSARAKAQGGRINVPEIQSSINQYGNSGDKATFLTGIRQTQKDILNNAISSYQFAYSDPANNKYMTEKQMLSQAGTPYAAVIQHRDNAENFLSSLTNRNRPDQTQAKTLNNQLVDPLNPANLGLNVQ